LISWLQKAPTIHRPLLSLAHKPRLKIRTGTTHRLRFLRRQAMPLRSTILTPSSPEISCN